MVQEVVASLKGFCRFEQRLDRHVQNSSERVFASLNVGSNYPKSSGFSDSQKTEKLEEEGKEIG